MIKEEIPKYLLTYLQTLTVKKLKISVEQGRVVNDIKYNQTLRILYSVVHHHVPPQLEP